MIYSVRGTLVHMEPRLAVVECGGVGGSVSAGDYVECGDVAGQTQTE